MNKPIRCTTHFHACDCREYEFEMIKRQLEIQTKRVENLKKSNEFYSEKDNWEQPIIRGYQALRAEKILDRDCVKTEDGVFTGGKLARSCQAIDQELEKQLEEVK